MERHGTLRWIDRLAATLLMALALAGCNTAPKKDPAYAPVRPSIPARLPEQNGAIFQAGYEVSWFENLRARRAGDILTVKLVEKTKANKKAKTDVSKENTTGISNPTILGSSPLFNAPSFLPLASTKDNNLAFGLESSSEFGGDGKSEQSNLLEGDITVTVTEVLANGYLMVRGEKRIGINQGNEYIRLSGIVRPIDIDSDNTVLSTRLADPTIVYVGDGAVADASAMGWLARFFVSALFPF
ncbi:MAG: flagellar basal body L-ring protein FlgH [Gammaproteobacteria bacterium]|nr:flagellar basal body L-ring protein FlgH [Gammaproteobacteria bacterium]